MLSQCLILSLLLPLAESSQQWPERNNASLLAASADGLDQINDESEDGKGGWLDALRIYTALSWTYAESRFIEGGPYGAEQILGIPKEGTVDYRNAALQLRYSFRPSDTLVLQLSHRRYGNSPIREVENEVELDWMFFSHRFGESTHLKIGRIQIPLGIFNEVRDIGTVLPFFRPAYMFYREGSFSSETVDGVLLGHEFSITSDWRLQLDVYAGEWELVEFPPGGVGGVNSPAATAEAEDAIGLHLWLDTPLTAVRLGAGAQQYLVSGGFLRQPEERTRWSDWHLSFEGDFEKFVLNAEYRQFNFQATTLTPQPIDIDVDTYYVQVGYRATDQLSFYIQSERANAQRESASFTARSKFRFWQDDAWAVNYRYRKFVFKLEGHYLELDATTVVDRTITPAGPLLTWANTRARGGRQYLATVAVSF